MTENTPKNQVIVGFIATGDELVQGDILNTNGQTMAYTLHEMGFQILQHNIVDDDEGNIAAAIEYQLQYSDIIILSGGLGPTSDDRTRFALAKAVSKELIFDDAAWQAICARLQSVNLNANDNNRQQAYFPQGATIFPNKNGTAAGCMLEHKGKIIFMLPGPPSECLPMFESYVLSHLQTHALPHFHFKWLLFGASEGDMAAALDKALQDIDCKTGYRWAYPYLEFKVFAASEADLENAEQLVTPLVANYLVSKNMSDYEKQLITLLTQKQLKLNFADDFLSQYVQSALLTNHSAPYLSNTNNDNTICVDIKGLKEYWQHQPAPVQTEVQIKLQYKHYSFDTKQNVYYRDHQILNYLVALVCKTVIAFAKEVGH